MWLQNFDSHHSWVIDGFRKSCFFWIKSLLYLLFINHPLAY